MENKYRIQNLLVLVAFVIAIGLLTAHAKAGERKPSREDLANLEDIARNQTCLADNRPAHTRVSNSFRNKQKVDPKDIPSYNRFLDCKYWNELEVNALARNGWAVRWDTMELVQKDTNSPVRIHSSQDVNKPVVSNAAPPGLDLDKLAIAVAKHETAYCTSPGSPTANARNNCWGIMHWPNGKRTLRTFKTTDEGKEAFKRIWAKSYKRFPDLALARTYSGNDKAAIWLSNVTRFYNEL
jgi:hypothetical protein